MDGPSIEEILPATPADRRAAGRAAVFGIPGLSAALFAGIVSGFLMGGTDPGSAAALGPCVSTSAAASIRPGPATLGPFDDLRSGMPAPPTLAPGATPSPAPLPVDGGGVQQPAWPRALSALLATAPAGLVKVSVYQEAYRAATGDGDWTVVISAGDRTATTAWFDGLPAWLTGHGLSGATPSMSTRVTGLRFLDAPGFSAVLADPSGGLSGAAAAGSAVRFRIAAGAMRADGTFAADTASVLTRRGCDPAAALPAPVAAIRDAVTPFTSGATESLEAAGCLYGGPAGSGDLTVATKVWALVAHFGGERDPAAVALAIRDAVAKTGITLEVSAWLGDLSGDPLAAYGTGYTYDLTPSNPAGGGCGGGWYLAISRDPERPDGWSIDVSIADQVLAPAAAQVGTCG